MNKKSLIYAALILFSPLTIAFLYSASDSDMTPSALLQIIYVSYGFGFIVLLFSACFHVFLGEPRKSIKLTTIASETLFLAVLLVYIFLYDEKNKSENIMWLPLIIFFLVVFTLPMTLLVSYGTGKLIYQIKNK